MIKILGFVNLEKNGAVATMRTAWPLRELNKHKDFKCRIVDAGEVLEIVQGRRDIREILGYDLYILSRIHGPAEGSPTSELTEAGGKVIYETDDDLTDRYRDLGGGGWVRDTVNLVDAVTVSTDHLGEEMSSFGKPIYVLPNLIDIRFYDKVSREAERAIDKLVIGLVGTQTHWADWMIPIEALKRIKEEYHDQVAIMTGGYCPKYLQRLVDYHIAPTSFSHYPIMLRQIDIRLCPLELGDKFNLSKSSIAAVEAMASTRAVGSKLGGAVPVVSDHPVYQETVEHGQNGFLVKDGDWYEALKEVIEDREKRESVSAFGHKWARKHADVRLGTARRAKVYKQIARS